VDVTTTLTPVGCGDLSKEMTKTRRRSPGKAHLHAVGSGGYILLGALEKYARLGTPTRASCFSLLAKFVL